MNNLRTFALWLFSFFVVAAALVSSTLAYAGGRPTLAICAGIIGISVAVWRIRIGRCADKMVRQQDALERAQYGRP